MVDEAQASAGRDPLEAQLTSCVQESLALYLFDNATFLGERLVAEFPTEVSAARAEACRRPLLWSQPLSAHLPHPGCRRTCSCWPPRTTAPTRRTGRTIC